MISPFNPGPVQPNNRLHASAMKVFGEADGDVAAVVPGLEDSYDDLACEFLSSWLTQKPSFETPSSTPADLTTSPEPPKAPEPSAPAQAKFTSFSLGEDWNLLP